MTIARERQPHHPERLYHRCGDPRVCVRPHTRIRAICGLDAAGVRTSLNKRADALLFLIGG